MAIAKVEKMSFLMDCSLALQMYYMLDLKKACLMAEWRVKVSESTMKLLLET